MRSLTRLSVCTLLGFLSIVPILYPATGTAIPFVKPQYFDVNGDPLVGAQLFVYTSGTSTKITTYSDAGLSSQNTNPVILDSAGRASVFVPAGTVMKLVMAPSTDSDPPVAPLWSVDGVSAVPGVSTSADVDVAVTAGANIASGDLVCLSDGGGGGTAGRWYPCDADFTYLSNLAPATGFATAAITTGSSGTVRRMGRTTGLTGLVAGSLYYASATAGGLTSTKPTNARAVGTADSSTTIILVPSNIDASSTLSGLVSTGTQTIAGAKTLSSVVVLSGGATYASGSSILDYKFARQTADVTKNNSIAQTDLTGLSFAVGASETWSWQCTLFGSSPVAADWLFTFTGPSAPTAVRFGAMTANDPPSTPGAASAFGNDIIAASTSGAEMIILNGILRNGSNAGTVQARMAQAVATVGNSTINTDSYCEARRTQ